MIEIRPEMFEQKQPVIDMKTRIALFTLIDLTTKMREENIKDLLNRANLGEDMAAWKAEKWSQVEDTLIAFKRDLLNFDEEIKI